MYLATWCSRVLTYPWMFLVLLPSQIFLPLNSITLLYCPMLVFLTQTLHTFFMSYNWPSVWVYGLLPCILHSCCNQLQWVLACGLIFPYLTVSSQGEGTIPMHLLFSFFFLHVCVFVHGCVCVCGDGGVTFVGACTCGSPRPIPGVFLDWPVPYSLRQGPSVEPTEGDM